MNMKVKGCRSKELLLWQKTFLTLTLILKCKIGSYTFINAVLKGKCNDSLGT